MKRRFDSELQVHFGANLAPAADFVLGPASEMGHDRQATTRTAFRGQRQDLRYYAGTSSIANTEREPVIGQLKLHLNTITLTASVTNRVRHELARDEQSVLDVLLVDPASTQCTFQLPSRLANRLRLGRKR